MIYELIMMVGLPFNNIPFILFGGLLLIEKALRNLYE